MKKSAFRGLFYMLIISSQNYRTLGFICEWCIRPHTPIYNLLMLLIPLGLEREVFEYSLQLLHLIQIVRHQ